MDELVIYLVHALASADFLQRTVDVLLFIWSHIQIIVPRDPGNLHALILVELQPLDGAVVGFALSTLVCDVDGAVRILQWVQIQAQHAVILPLIARLGILQVPGRGQSQFLVGVLHELAEFVVIQLDHLIVLVVDRNAAPKGPFLRLHILYGPVQFSRQSDCLTFINIAWTLE